MFTDMHQFVSSLYMTHLFWVRRSSRTSTRNY